MALCKNLPLTFLLLSAIWMSPSPSVAWHDNTHLAIAKAAGYSRWYNATGADQVKPMANAERFNHYCNLAEGEIVNAALVLSQQNSYNQKDQPRGHLYGAILGALQDYRNVKVTGKYAEYHLAFAAHYIGDLSQPLHNVPFDPFNKTYHTRFDGVVDADVMENLEQIRANMQPVDLGENPWTVGLPNEIARIANLARALDDKIRKEARMITREEAYQQLGLSAALLQAVIRVLEKPSQAVH